MQTQLAVHITWKRQRTQLQVRRSIIKHASWMKPIQLCYRTSHDCKSGSIHGREFVFKHVCKREAQGQLFLTQGFPRLPPCHAKPSRKHVEQLQPHWDSGCLQSSKPKGSLSDSKVLPLPPCHAKPLYKQRGECGGLRKPINRVKGKV